MACSQIDLQLESGEYFLKPHQKEAREARRRKEKVGRNASIVALAADVIFLHTARGGYRQTAGRTSRSVRTSKGGCCPSSRREEKAKAEREGGGRNGWREAAQEQEEKEEGGNGGGRDLIPVSLFPLMLPYYSRNLPQVSGRSAFEVSSGGGVVDVWSC